VRWLALLGLLALAGCGSGSSVRTYVLSPPAEPMAGAVSQAGRPIIELRPVSIPDYMDTTDILVRDGRNEFKASTTGRWGERLSEGITQALWVELSRRLPAFQIARTRPPGQPVAQLLIDVEAFDLFPDGRCVLSARWTIAAADRRTTLASERGTVTATAPLFGGAITDDAATAAMAQAVGRLADDIAAVVSRVGAGRFR